ncbi:MAG: hypothetical protein Q8K97_08140 [Pseudohongiella sp.]|nr:hypothetical protein [Pseudohongiella sp.]
MNVRPKTTQFFSDMLRRPLLWAALCSIVLHLPVLALLSLQMSRNEQPMEEGMLLTLLPSTESDSPDESQPGVAMMPDVADMKSAASLQRAETEQGPQPSPLAEPDQGQPGQERFVNPGARAIVQTLTGSSMPAATESMPAVTEIVEPLQTPLTTTAEISTSLPPPVPAIAPAFLPMTEPAVSEMHSAIQHLLDRINQSGVESGLLSLNQLTSQLPGLSEADQVSAVAVPVDALTGLQQINVTVTRRINGRPFQLSARLQERALSHYAKFVNRWDDNVMLSNDRIEGRFHANSEVNFEVAAHARPQFAGEVTIASRQSVASRVRQSTMFANGIRTGTGRIAVPRESLPASWYDSGATVVELGSDARLEFQGSDGVLLTDIGNNQKTQLQIPAAGLVIIGEGRKRIEVSGTVTGRVLVYSPRQVLITGNLVYADSTADSADTLALISDGSIEIAPVSVTGNGDLQIHGALFARQRFSVRRFRDRHQGTLHVYGSLVAGSVSATEPRFYTHIRYDPRFNYSRPPAFPSAGLFDLLEWDQHWGAVNDADAPLADVADNAAIAVP